LSQLVQVPNDLLGMRRDIAAYVISWYRIGSKMVPGGAESAATEGHS